VYKTIIKIKEDLTQEIINEIQDVSQQDFNNRAGRVENSSDNRYVMIFEGDDSLIGCLQLGIISLHEKIADYVTSWEWIDIDEPWESCDVLKELSIPIF